MPETDKFVKLSQGAEAVIFKHNDLIYKQRQRKRYRLKQLDDTLNHSRLLKEAKMLARVPVKTPQLIMVDTVNATLVMEYVDASTVKSAVDADNFREIGALIARDLTLMHSENCIHGDLTTSNILIKNGDLWWIDFGLSIVSSLIEDKAVDLYVLARAIESTHPLFSQEFVQVILDNYGDKMVLDRLEQVKMRGRKREMLG